MTPLFRLLFPIVLIGAGIGCLFTLAPKKTKEEKTNALPAPNSEPLAAPLVSEKPDLEPAAPSA